MKLTRLSVANFRALTNLTFEGIGDSVVIAGPNGCGKSCVLDAIRLLKSAYGSYQQDEWQSWFGEFAINLNAADASYLHLLQAHDRPLILDATFTISTAEKEYLTTAAEDLLRERVSRDVSTEMPRRHSGATLALAANQRRNRQAVDRAVAADMPRILEALKSEAQHARVTISPDGRAEAIPNLLLELIFSTYEPQKLGVVDYHGPNRAYAREKVGNINLTIEASAQKQRQHALYNYANKYANLKTEMGAAYVRHLLARQANPATEHDDSLTSTLKELFLTFFPGKEFLGPRPTIDGKLLFPVRISTGAEHDIDELSCGEKEVLYGYLRLHNSAPWHSMIMIDEPELHLNPRLLAGLASFYHKHLGKPYDNQLFLVTHSDTLIREAVRNPAYSVFHIQPPTEGEANQASKVEAADATERLVLDLVGDLATYRPGARLAIFESTENCGFDARVVYALFPELRDTTNPISAGSKRRVNELFEVLEAARVAGHLHIRFFAIADSDNEVDAVPHENRLIWDAYHIENYFLVEDILLGVLNDLHPEGHELSSPDAVGAALVKIARETIPALVLHQLRSRVWTRFTESLSNSTDPKRADVGVALAEAANRSAARLKARLANDLSEGALSAEEASLSAEYQSAIADGTWRKRFRGRDILRRFVGAYVPGMPYEYFRDLILTRMRDVGHRPPGMNAVVRKLLTS